MSMTLKQLTGKMRTRFHKRAYRRHKFGLLGLAELEVCIFFDTPALQSLLFSFFEVQNHEKVCESIRNITGVMLNPEQSKKILEVVLEHKDNNAPIAYKNSSGKTGYEARDIGVSQSL